MADRTPAGSLLTSWPATTASPPVTEASVERILMMVVLPAPLGPRSPKTSPSSTEKVTPSTALVEGG